MWQHIWYKSGNFKQIQILANKVSDLSEKQVLSTKLKGKLEISRLGP